MKQFSNKDMVYTAYHKAKGNTRGVAKGLSRCRILFEDDISWYVQSLTKNDSIGNGFRYGLKKNWYVLRLAAPLKPSVTEELKRERKFIDNLLNDIRTFLLHYTRSTKVCFEFRCGQLRMNCIEWHSCPKEKVSIRNWISKLAKEDAENVASINRVGDLIAKILFLNLWGQNRKITREDMLVSVSRHYPINIVRSEINKLFGEE